MFNLQVYIKILTVISSWASKCKWRVQMQNSFVNFGELQFFFTYLTHNSQNTSMGGNHRRSLTELDKLKLVTFAYSGKAIFYCYLSWLKKWHLLQKIQKWLKNNNLFFVSLYPWRTLQFFFLGQPLKSPVFLQNYQQTPPCKLLKLKSNWKNLLD